MLKKMIEYINDSLVLIKLHHPELFLPINYYMMM